MVDLSSWTKTAGGNSRTPPDGAPEGMTRTTVNDSMREVMAVVRRWYDDPEWLEVTRDVNGDELVPTKLSADVLRITSTIDFTSYFPADRSVLITGGTPNDVTAVVASSTFSGTTTDITLAGYSSGTEIPTPNPNLKLFAYFSKSSGAIAGGNLGFYTVTAKTDVGIQLAIDTANAAGGGIVILNRGTYTVGATINLKSGVYVWGPEPGAAVLTLNANVDAEMWNVNAGTFMGLRGLKMDCNRANQTAGDGIKIADNVVNLRIDDCFITGARQDGIHHLASSTSCDQVWINRNRIIDSGRHGIAFFDSQSNLDNIFITDNEIEDVANSINDSAGILAAGSVSIKGNSITNLDAVSPATPRGIWLYQIAAAEPNTQSAFRASCEGNHIQGTAQLGIAIQVGGRYCTISGNTIDMTGSAAKGIWAHSVTLPAEVPIGNVIADNVIHRATTGIHIDHAGQEGHNAVADNTMLVMNASGGIGIIVNGNACAIRGNTVKDWAAATQGILVSGNDNHIESNHLPEANTDGITVSGDANHITGNNLRSSKIDMTAAASGNTLSANTMASVTVAGNSNILLSNILTAAAATIISGDLNTFMSNRLVSGITLSGDTNRVLDNALPIVSGTAITVTGASNEVRRNTAPNSSTTISYGSGAGNVIFHNTPRQDKAVTIRTTDLAITPSATFVAWVADVAFPVTPNGVRRFKFKIHTNFEVAAGNDDIIIKLEWGSSGVGVATSGTVAQSQFSSIEVRATLFAEYTIVPATSDTFSIRFATFFGIGTVNGDYSNSTAGDLWPFRYSVELFEDEDL